MHHGHRNQNALCLADTHLGQDISAGSRHLRADSRLPAPSEWHRRSQPLVPKRGPARLPSTACESSAPDSATTADSAVRGQSFFRAARAVPVPARSTNRRRQFDCTFRDLNALAIERPRIAIAIVLFPEPLCPTSPSTSPRRIANSRRCKTGGFSPYRTGGCAERRRRVEVVLILCPKISAALFQ